ncbi:hypothetical protein CPB86DRAFT_819366 [Serendipita vermifera]|nr:hypothetical protein CPB86DRAFT_819366 [Serendipita vermifera]
MSALRHIWKRKGKRKVGPNDEDSGMDLGDLNPTNVPSIFFNPSTDSFQTQDSRINASSHPSSSTSQPTLGGPPFAHEGPNTAIVVSKPPITADISTKNGKSTIDDGDSKSTLRERRVLSGIGHASKTMEISKISGRHLGYSQASQGRLWDHRKGFDDSSGERPLIF